MNTYACLHSHIDLTGRVCVCVSVGGGVIADVWLSPGATRLYRSAREMNRAPEK